MRDVDEPPYADVDDHPLAPEILKHLRDVFDPEIPVNIYELGLIYRLRIGEDNAVKVDMTLTSPGCPVAAEMPGMVERAVRKVDAIPSVSVNMVWDPPWTMDMMAETAKLDMGVVY